MAYNLNAFEQNDMSIGVMSFQSDFTAIPALKLESVNISTGINRGIGPRFGMAPIPGQMDNTAIVASPPYACNIRQAERTLTGQVLSTRYACFATYPISIHPWPSSTIETRFIWLLGRTSTENNSNQVITSVMTRSSTITAPFSCDSLSNSDTSLSEYNSYISPISWGSPWPTSLSNSQFEPYLQTLMNSQGLYAVESTHMTVAGANIPQPYIAGAAVGSPVTNGSYAVNFVATGQLAPNSRKILGGVPYSIQTQTYNTSPRTITVTNWSALSNVSPARSDYTYTAWSPSQATPTAAIYQNQSTVQLTFPTANSYTVTGGSNASVMVFDSLNTVNSSYDAVLIAGPKPSIIIYQDWLRNEDGTYEQYFDPTSLNVYPVDQTTLQPGIVTATAYTENGSQTSTCFAFCPKFVSGTASDGTIPANSGILRANTVYEFAFSYYNKRLNFETNVGTPCKWQTGSNDYTYAQSIDIPIWYHGNGSYDPPGLYTAFSVNDYEARYYYRQLGSFDWLPAAIFDLTALIFSANSYDGKLCTGPIAQVPGGQPGAFEDYSLLPQDDYDCVFNWQTRAFWLSKSNLVFSRKGNVFAYPVTNQVSCPSGEFRGATIHAYPGDAEQRGRLIVWGSDESYIAWFTGNPTTETVQVGAGNFGQYPLDGSDFTIQRWTTCSAFQHKAACVAEGELYFWGPKGVFHDNGTDFPERISQFTIEPALFSLPHPQYVSEIFSHYSYRTKEIFWFYRSAANSSITSALVLNTRSGAFYQAQFNCKIDSIYDIDISNTLDTQTGLVGRRTIVNVRESSSATVQRPYFFDSLNTGIDQSPLHDCLCIGITVAGNQMNMLLAPGYDTGTISSLTAGDLVCFSQIAAYTEASSLPDCIAQFVSYTGGAHPSITVTLPASVVSSYASSGWAPTGNKEYFPIFFPRLTGVNWVVSTQYWTPNGMQAWYRWLFTHFQARVNLLPDQSGTAYQFNMAYQTPISSSPGSKTLTWVNNSDANCQIYSPLPGPNQQFEGQGIRHKLSGVHPGGSWVLQYMCIYGEPQEGDQLQIFEE